MDASLVLAGVQIAQLALRSIELAQAGDLPAARAILAQVQGRVRQAEDAWAEAANAHLPDNPAP